MTCCCVPAANAPGADADRVPRPQRRHPPPDGRPARAPPRATAALATAERLMLVDLVLAECVYVLEFFYEVGRERIAELMRAAIAVPAIEAVDPELLLRSLEIYERDRLDFAEAYLIAQAEASGVTEILSFDRSIDRVESVTRREP
jgi:predicted nucleic-acid-binding protein